MKTVLRWLGPAILLAAATPLLFPQAPDAQPSRQLRAQRISEPPKLDGVKGGAKLDHFGGVKLDQLEMDPRVCFEFLWDGWNVA